MNSFWKHPYFCRSTLLTPESVLSAPKKWDYPEIPETLRTYPKFGNDVV